MSKPTPKLEYPLIVEPFSAMKNKKQCKRNHPAHFNCKILGSNKRFCTFILETNGLDGKGHLMCGDVI